MVESRRNGIGSNSRFFTWFGHKLTIRAVQGPAGLDPPIAYRTQPNPPPTEPIAPAVGNGFHSPKTEISRSDIGSPPLKSKKPDLIDPSIFLVRKCRSDVCWDFFGKT